MEKKQRNVFSKKGGPPRPPPQQQQQQQQQKQILTKKIVSQVNKSVDDILELKNEDDELYFSDSSNPSDDSDLIPSSKESYSGVSFMKTELLFKDIVGNNEISVPLKTISNHSRNDYLWYDWINDFVLWRLIQKNVSHITSIDLCGSQYITDSGIVELAKMIPKMPSLTSINLQGCPQLTEVSLIALLQNCSAKVNLNMEYTGVTCATKNLLSSRTNVSVTEDFQFNAGSSFPLNLSSTYEFNSSLVIWPEPSLEFSTSSILVDKTSENITSHGISYSAAWKLTNRSTVLLNCVELHKTQSPSQHLLPNRISQVLITIGEDFDKGVNHLLKTMAYFLSKDEDVCSVPQTNASSISKTKSGSENSKTFTLDTLPQRPTVTYESTIKTERVLEKKTVQSKKKKKQTTADDVNEEEIMTVTEPSPQASDKTNYGVTFNMNCENGWLQTNKFHQHSFWRCDDSFSMMMSAFSFFVEIPSGFAGSCGVSIVRESFPIILEENLSVDLINHSIIQNKIRTDAKFSVPRGKVLEITITLRARNEFFDKTTGNFLPNAAAVFCLLVDSETIFSCGFKFGETVNPLHPCLFVKGVEKAPPRMPAFFVPKEFSEPGGEKSLYRKLKDKFTDTAYKNGVNFVVACTGNERKANVDKILQYDYKKGLTQFSQDLESVMNKTLERMKRGILPNWNEQIQFSQASRALSNIQRFIANSKKRLAAFQLEVNDTKQINELKKILATNVEEEARLRPYLMEPSDFQTRITELKNKFKSKKIVRTSQLGLSLSQVQQHVLLKELHNSSSWLYFTEEECIVTDPAWFFRIFYDIILAPHHKASGLVQGLHTKAEVWSQKELHKTLSEETLDANEEKCLIEVLRNMGALIELPCIRFKTADEKIVYTNPFNSGHKEEELKRFIDARSQDQKLVLASMTYSSNISSLYSLFPALVSLTSRIGTLQMLTPRGMVAHVGAAEVMISADGDSIEIASYCHCSNLPAKLRPMNSTYQTNLLVYLWSITHLYTDTMESLLHKYHITASCQSSSKEGLDLPNRSICYRHKWELGKPGQRSVCSLCNNCTSPNGLLCPYNRIPGIQVDACLCETRHAGCETCGICKQCANMLWRTHCKSEPNRLAEFNVSRQSPDIHNRKVHLVQPEEPLQPALPTEVKVIALAPTEMSLQLHHQRLNASIVVFPGPGSSLMEYRKSDYNSFLAVPQSVVMRMSEYHTDDVSEIKEDITYSSVPLESRICYKMNVNQTHRIITYDNEESPSSLDVGLFVGKYPFSEERNSFSITVLDRGQSGYIAVGVVPKNYPLNAQPGWKTDSMAYHADDGILFSGANKRNLGRWDQSGVTIKVTFDFKVLPPSLIWYKNGEEVVRQPIKKEIDLYPAVGMHSYGEQVKIDLSHFQEDPSKKFGDLDSFVHKIQNFKISPAEAISFVGSSPSGQGKYSTGLVFLHTSSPTYELQITFRSDALKTPNQVNLRFLGQNIDIVKPLEENSMSTTYKVSRGDKITTFFIEIDFTILERFAADGFIRFVATFPNSQKVTRDLKVQLDPEFGREDYNYSKLTVIENNGTNKPVYKNGYLVEVNPSIGKGYSFWIPRGPYVPRVMSTSPKDIVVSMPFYTKPLFTHCFRPGNVVLYQDPNTKKYSPKIVFGVDLSKNTIQVAGMKTAVQMPCANIHPITASFIPKHTRSMLPTFPNISLFYQNSTVNLASISDNNQPLLFRDFRCSDLTAYQVAGIEALSRLSVTSCHVIENMPTQTHVPLNMLFLPDLSKHELLLRPYSLLEITDSSSLLLHLLCTPRVDDNEEFPEKTHFLDHPGTPVDKCGDELAFVNSTSIFTYLTASHRPVRLSQCETMLPSVQLKSKNQIEYQLWMMLRKYASYSALHLASFGKILPPIDLNVLCSQTSGDTPIRSESEDSLRSSLIQRVVSAYTANKKSDGDGSGSQIVDLMQTNRGNVCISHANKDLTMDQEVSPQGMPMKNGVLFNKKHPIFLYADCISTLTIKGNEAITSIPNDFFPNMKLTLRSLTVKKFPNLMDLSDIFSNLLPLRYLSLQYLPRLKTLPASLTKLTNLRKISLDQVGITALPDVAATDGKIKNKLESISLFLVPLKKMPTSWSRYENLKSLCLENVPISDLPPSFSKLISLETLTIRGVSWKDDIVPDLNSIDKSQIPNFIATVNNDKVENKMGEHSFFASILEDKQLKELSECSSAMEMCAKIAIDVPRIGLGYSKEQDQDLGGFPLCLFSLVNLKTVSITLQAVRFLPKQAINWEQLHSLNLSHNPLLEDITPQLGSLLDLKEVNLRRCPSLRTPPLEVVSRGSESIISYFKFLSSDQVDCYRTKLMLVGLGGVGKTSLLQALLSRSNAATKSTDKDPITDGIDIGRWTVQMSNKTVEYSTWDFAGQTIYYNTHQFFLSKRAVYLLMWTVRLGYEHAGLDFWLSSIMCHAPNAPVFVVGTHCDKVERFDIPMKLLRERYPQIVAFHFVSCVTGKGIPELKEAIHKHSLEQPYMGEKIPRVIFNFESALVDRRKQESYMKWEEVQKIGIQHGLFNDKDLKEAVSFLHDLGTVQFFDREVLREMVVINPQWITDVMACVVSVKNSPIIGGMLKHDDMSKVWADFPGVDTQWLLRLTEEFDLTFRQSDQAVNIVPCLLPDEEPIIQMPSYNPDTDIYEARLTYLFSYLPGGLFNRIQVRLFDFTKCLQLWKRGCHLEKNGHKALVRQVNEQLEIHVSGLRPYNVMFMIHEVIVTLIKESFAGVIFSMNIPCPDCQDSGNVNSDSILDVSLVRRARDKNTIFLQCRAQFHVPLLSKLMTIVPPISEEDFNFQLESSLFHLKDLGTSLHTQIVVLYCKSDFEQNPTFQIADLVSSLASMNYKIVELHGTHREAPIYLAECKLMVAILSHKFMSHRTLVNLFLGYVTQLKKPYKLVLAGPDKDCLNNEVGMQLNNPAYFDMTHSKKDSIKQKLEELKIAVQKVIEVETKKNTFDCFLSYSWKNSHSYRRSSGQAINEFQGSLGWEGGDPRQLSAKIKEAGLTCWIDTDEVGQNNLMADIHKGLRASKVFICCVSCEYDQSSNCQMEMEFALNTLKRPVIYLLVGNGEEWRETQAAMLMKKKEGIIINMQLANPNAHSQLLEAIKKLSSSQVVSLKEKSPNQTSSKSKSTQNAFLEEIELAQRKFLQQISIFDQRPYPRLVVIDFIETAESLKQDKKWTEMEPCLRYLCEHEQGWHIAGEVLPLPTTDPLLFTGGALYLHKMYSLLNSSRIALTCLHVPQSQDFLQLIAKTAQEQAGRSGNPLKEAYEAVKSNTKHDTEQVRGGLKRVLLGSGKVIWLCPEHIKSHGRVTIIPDTGVSSVATAATVFEGDRLLRDVINQLKSYELSLYGQEFTNSVKAHQKQCGQMPTSSPTRPQLKRQETSLDIIKGAVTVEAASSLSPLRPKTGRAPARVESIPEENSNKQTNKPAAATTNTTTTTKPPPAAPKPTKPASSNVQTATSRACVLQ